MRSRRGWIPANRKKVTSALELMCAEAGARQFSVGLGCGPDGRTGYCRALISPAIRNRTLLGSAPAGKRWMTDRQQFPEQRPWARTHPDHSEPGDAREQEPRCCSEDSTTESSFLDSGTLSHGRNNWLGLGGTGSKVWRSRPNRLSKMRAPDPAPVNTIANLDYFGGRPSGSAPGSAGAFGT